MNKDNTVIFTKINEVMSFIEDKLPYDNVWTMLVKKKQDFCFTVRVRVMIDERGYEYHMEVIKTEFLLSIKPTRKLDAFISEIITAIVEGEKKANLILHKGGKDDSKSEVKKENK